MHPFASARTLGFTLLLAAAASPALAAGINLAWDDCSLGSPTMMKTFACDTNVGAPFTLVGSFNPPEGLDQLIGMEAVLDLCTMPVALPDWWRVGPGDCRQNAISVSFDFTGGPFNCPDPWQGQAVGGFTPQVATLGFTRLRLLMACAIPTPVAVSSSTAPDFYAFKVHILRSNTLSCSGCQTNACIVLNEIRLAQPQGVGDFVLTNPAVSYNALWQGENQSPICPFVVPTRESSWGAVKALYR